MSSNLSDMPRHAYEVGLQYNTKGRRRYELPLSDSEIFNLWETGYTANEILDKMGLPQSTRLIGLIYSRLKMNPRYKEVKDSKPFNGNKKKKYGINMDTVLALLREGKTIYEIAHVMDVHYHVLYYRAKTDIRTSHFTKRGKILFGMTKLELDEIITMYLNGTSIKEINKKYKDDPTNPRGSPRFILQYFNVLRPEDRKY